MKLKPAWPEDRLKDIETLQLLLREVRTIDNGSHVIERLQRCIALADKLADTDYQSGRASFTQFLITQGWKEEP
jgi:hypothetical protein